MVDKIPPKAEKEINDRYPLEKRRNEKRMQWLLLRAAGIDPDTVVYDPNGKPRLPEKGIFISFSHSGMYSVLMISRTPCGIDLEMENPKIARIAPKFLNGKEEKFLTRPGSLPFMWCIKEAIFKYFGERVTFKEDVLLESFSPDFTMATAGYRGVHGKGKFELSLYRFENYYLAFTKSFTTG